MVTVLEFWKNTRYGYMGRVLCKEDPEEDMATEHGRVCGANTPACVRRVCEACKVLEYVFLHIPPCFIESLFLFDRLHLSKLESKYSMLFC